MRFHLGPIPVNESFQPAPPEWRPLREPSPLWFQLLALPVAIASLLVLWKAWAQLPLDVPRMEGARIPAIVLVLFLALVPLHELVHGLFHPRLGRSDASIYGFWPARLVFFAHYDDVVTRNRFLLILLAPTLALSIAPLCVCFLLGRSHWLLAVVSLLNVVAASGDLTGALVVLPQVPASARVRNRGYYTWWQPALREMRAA